MRVRRSVCCDDLIINLESAIHGKVSILMLLGGIVLATRVDWPAVNKSSAFLVLFTALVLRCGEYVTKQPCENLGELPR